MKATIHIRIRILLVPLSALSEAFVPRVAIPFPFKSTSGNHFSQWKRNIHHFSLSLHRRITLAVVQKGCGFYPAKYNPAG